MTDIQDDTINLVVAEAAVPAPSLDRLQELVARIPTDDPQFWSNEQYAEEDERQAWRIEGKKQAAWAMEKLAGYARAQSENYDIANERIARLQEQIKEVREWASSENDKLQGSVDYFTNQLKFWHMAQITADPNDEEEWKKEKFKTIKLPDGEVSVRKGSYSTEIEDQELFLRWVHDHASPVLAACLVKREPVIKKDEVARHIKETGEVPSGVKYQRSEAKYDVKPKVGE